MLGTGIYWPTAGTTGARLSRCSWLHIQALHVNAASLYNYPFLSSFALVARGAGRDGWPVTPEQTMPVLVSGHGFSLDGLEWRFNVAEQPYNASITFENGTRQHFSTFERPHLLFNADGKPTHLVVSAVI